MKISRAASTKKNAIRDSAVYPVVFITLDYNRIEVDILPRSLLKRNIDRPSRIIERIDLDAE
jgi:hypothetical protein